MELKVNVEQISERSSHCYLSMFCRLINILSLVVSVLHRDVQRTKFNAVNFLAIFMILQTFISYLATKR